MVCSHRRSAEEGTSAPLLPETAEEVWNEPQHPQILLHFHVTCIMRAHHFTKLENDISKKI